MRGRVTSFLYSPAGHVDFHSGPLSRMRLDFERSLQQADTLLHADQAKSSLALDLVQIEAVACIFNPKCDAIFVP